MVKLTFLSTKLSQSRHVVCHVHPIVMTEFALREARGLTYHEVLLSYVTLYCVVWLFVIAEIMSVR